MNPPVPHRETGLHGVFQRVAVFLRDVEFEVEMLGLGRYAPMVQPSFEGDLAELQAGDGAV